MPTIVKSSYKDGDMNADARSTDVRYPLIVVDRSRDPDRYDSGWLRLIERHELASVPVGPTIDMWDQAGRPAKFTVLGPVLRSQEPDPAAREVLTQWRQRMPRPYLGTGPAGDTAIQYVVSDVAAAKARLTPDGAIARPQSPVRRLLPVFLMLLAALALIPLVQAGSWGIGVIVVWYVAAAAVMHRWSYPPAWWGNPPRRDDPDLISRAAVASKVVFWGVAAAAATLALLDWVGMTKFLSWV